MSEREVQIRLDGRHGQVVIDGQDVSSGITCVDVEAMAGQLPVVTLHVAMPQVVLDGKAVVKLPEVSVRALRGLGWTPPHG